MDFLHRKNFRDYHRSKLTARLRDVKGDSYFFNIKGKGVNVWHIPEFESQNESHELPEFNESPNMTLSARAQVILGPPGTGKTSTLLGLLEEELERGTEPERIGFFTFTKQAVKEGKTRALERFDISPKNNCPYF